MKYYLCVDEKGEFENRVFKEQSSSVGGYICDETQYRQLKLYCSNALDIHNKKYPNLNLDSNKLHFRVLHCGQDWLRPQDQWRYPAEIGQSFIKTLIQQIEGKLNLICRTSGSPALNLHPQHNYTICLISLIAGIITDNENILKNATELVVRVAIRHSKVLSGMAAYDPDTYWDVFSKQIVYVIKKSGILKKLNIIIQLGDANKDKDLIIADILLGAMSSSVYSESLSGFKKRLYEVNNFYHISLTNKPSEFLNNLIDTNRKEEAIILALDFLNSDDKNQISAGESFLGKKLPDLISDENTSKNLAAMLDLRLNSILFERYTSPSALINIRKITSKIIQIHEENKIDPTPQLLERCLYYLIHCEAHEGISPVNPSDSYSEKYEHFFNISGTQIYPSLPERIHRRLETKLIAVQTLYFNTFLFEKLETHLRKDIKDYENAFGIYHKTEKTDDLYARLCGTYGQSLGFIGSIYNNEDQIKTAIDYLKLDVSYLPDDSIFKFQGYSFITSGYWMLNDLNGCRDSFKQQYGTIKDEKELIDKIFKNEPLEGGSIFQYLDWIRYAEMNDRLKENNGKIIGITSDILTLTVNKIKHLANEYPYNLFIKWFAVMEYRAGAKSKSLKLLELINQKPKEDSIFYIMTSVVTRMIIKSINKENIYGDDIINHIKNLSERYSGFLRFAEIKGLSEKKELDIEEIARLMPYYYS